MNKDYDQGPAMVTEAVSTCRACGAVVDNQYLDEHDEFHENLAKVSQAAYSADAIWRPLG